MIEWQNVNGPAVACQIKFDQSCKKLNTFIHQCMMLHKMQGGAVQFMALGAGYGCCRAAIFARSTCFDLNDRQQVRLFQDEVQFAKICHSVILRHDGMPQTQKVVGNSRFSLPAVQPGR